MPEAKSVACAQRAIGDGIYRMLGSAKEGIVRKNSGLTLRSGQPQNEVWVLQLSRVKLFGISSVYSFLTVLLVFFDLVALSDFALA